GARGSCGHPNEACHALGRDDQALDLSRQLVGVAIRPARTVGEGLETVFLIALEDLVAGLARNAERTTDLAHRFAVQQLSDKPQALVHHRTLLPRHPRLPRKGERCYPCVRYDLSPMSRAQNDDRAFAPDSGGHIPTRTTGAPMTVWVSPRGS